MELKFEKNTVCRLAAKGKWGSGAAAWMGLSFFLRMVYYFGFQNLNDVPGGEIACSVVLPLILSAAFILVLKIQKFTYPIAAAGLSVAAAANYFLCERMDFGGVISGICVLALAGLILAAVLGYIPERKWLLWTAIAALAVRVVFVDVFGYILPLNELNLIAYIPKASNLFCVASLSSLAAALRLRVAE